MAHSTTTIKVTPRSMRLSGPGVVAVQGAGANAVRRLSHSTVRLAAAGWQDANTLCGMQAPCRGTRHVRARSVPRWQVVRAQALRQAAVRHMLQGPRPPPPPSPCM